MREIIKGFQATSQDDYQLNVTNIIKHAARNYGGQEIAARRPDGTMFRYTYREAYERMQRLANALKGLGAVVGDRIGVLAWNTRETYEIFFGVPGTGSVMLLLNLRLLPQQLSWVVNHSSPRFIIVDESLIPLAEEIAAESQKVEGYIIITDKDIRDIKTKLRPVYSYEALLAGAAPQFNWPNLDEKSAYAACYTTGTTGRPKGVYYSHRNVFLHSSNLIIRLGMGITDCSYQITPIFHIMGWCFPQASTMVGAKLVYPGKYSLDELEALSRIMVQENVSLVNGAPAFFLALLQYFRTLKDPPNLGGARLLMGGSEPPLDMIKGYHDLVNAEVIHAYGATETTPVISCNRPKPWLDRKLSETDRWDLKRKQGYFSVMIDVKAVDLRGNEVPRDGKTPGEILLRGPWVTGAYYDAPGSEAQFTEDGYWRSGDIGTLDSEGFLKITDRLKDVIKSGGEWISSVDLENAIIAHPAVVEAAVVGVPHAKWEERPLALVVLREGSAEKMNADEIRSHLSKTFAKWQLPDKVLFVKSIPKTSVGKYDKKVIREQYKDAYAGVPSR
jgi:fatty-acyl-CoA synthase